LFRNSTTSRSIAALAIAIALHAILAALVPAPGQQPPQREVVSHVAIVRVTVRPPPPPPTPQPARTRAPAGIPAPAPARGARTRHSGSTRVRSKRAEPLALAATKPVGGVPAGDTGAGAGPGVSSAGRGGSGAGDGGAPCGFVEFSDPHGSRYDPQTHGAWVDIEMSVRFPDGHSEMLSLDYPWFYPNDAANPWSEQNLHDPDFPTTFQSPPPEKRANEPALVQYVIAHTSTGGYTLLKDCPSPTPQ
jgi:hypothetical protein